MRDRFKLLFSNGKFADVNYSLNGRASWLGAVFFRANIKIRVQRDALYMCLARKKETFALNI